MLEITKQTKTNTEVKNVSSWKQQLTKKMISSTAVSLRDTIESWLFLSKIHKSMTLFIYFPSVVSVKSKL